MKLLRIGNKQRGFTIVEMLIATTVFSVLLLITSVAIVGLARQYYKGVTQSKTQNTARSISEELARNIQYSTESIRDYPTPAGQGKWCIADRAYAWVEDRTVNSTSSAWSLIRSRSDGLENCDTLNSLTASSVRPVGYQELLGENMRLIALTITNASGDGDVWQVRARVAYATDDQLCNPDAPGDCGAIGVSSFISTNDNLICKGQAGSEYCAVSEYVTTVVRRMQI